jgi:hypothetical protein
MRIVKREIRLEFSFTLGPGDMDAAEADAFAQLAALATKMNGGVLPHGLAEGLAPVCQDRVKQWHCNDCRRGGQTERGEAIHMGRYHPLAALGYEPVPTS